MALGRWRLVRLHVVYRVHSQLGGERDAEMKRHDGGGLRLLHAEPTRPPPPVGSRGEK